MWWAQRHGMTPDDPWFRWLLTTRFGGDPEAEAAPFVTHLRPLVEGDDGRSARHSHMCGRPRAIVPGNGPAYIAGVYTLCADGA